MQAAPRFSFLASELDRNQEERILSTIIALYGDGYQARIWYELEVGLGKRYTVHNEWQWGK